MIALRFSVAGGVGKLKLSLPSHAFLICITHIQIQRFAAALNPGQANFWLGACHVHASQATYNSQHHQANWT
jgi:hypothetical protein